MTDIHTRYGEAVAKAIKAMWDSEVVCAPADDEAAATVLAKAAIDALLPALLSQFDEDWFADVIGDSLDVDWTARDAARLIMSRLKEELGHAPD